MSWKLKIEKKVVAYVYIYLLLVLIFLIIPHSVLLNRILGILTILCSIGWVYKCWNNMYLLIMSMFIAYSNYSIVMGIYLDESLRPRYLYPQITELETYSIGIFMIFLTMLSLMILSPKCKKINIAITKKFIIKSNKNGFMFVMLMILFLCIVLLGYVRAENSRGSSTAIYEYASIFIILMFYFSGNCKKYKKICALCCWIYVMTSLLNGTRVEALMCMIIFILCYFENEINPLIVLFAMILGLFAFSVIGILRGNWSSLKGNVDELISVLIRNKFVFDTCTYAYFPMICMINIYKNYSFSTAIYFLGKFILTIFMGASRVKDGNLSQVVKEIFYHNDGGVSQGFFFVWFSYMGALIYSIIILLYTRIINDEKMILTPIKCCTIIYVVASVPRWYLYGPWSLLRGILICVIICGFFIYLGRVFRK